MAKDTFMTTGVILSSHIKADSEHALHNACQMIFNGAGTSVAVAYKVIDLKTKDDPGIALVLYWRPVEGSTSFPEPITNGHDAHTFLRRWFFQQEQNKFQIEYPEGDGSHGLGYEIFTGWENVGYSAENGLDLDPWYVLMVFKPIRIYYSK